MDPLLIPLIISVVVMLGLGGFGIWSYVQYLDQRDYTDEKIAVAVTDANAAQKEELEADFAEREKEPYRRWVSPASVGSVEIQYPRTWSGYVEEDVGGSNPVDAFFHPSVVPADKKTQYALRLVVDETAYEKIIEDYDRELEEGTVTAKPIEISGVTGQRFDGQIERDISGALVIFPLRDKTLQIWTQSNAYVADFNSIILENLTFEK